MGATDDNKAVISGGGNRFEISGPLTFATVEQVAHLPNGWQAGSEPVVIDLRGVPRADSAGLALMVEWWREARSAGRALRIVNIPARLQDLIRVNGLQDLFLNHAQ